MKIAVTRMGALFHYSIPKTVNRLGMLGRFYTDVWSDKAWARPIEMMPGKIVPDRIKRLLGRCSKELATEFVTDFPMLALRYGLARRKARNPEEEIHAHIWAGQEFCRLIIADGLDGCDAVYTTNSQGLELLQYARKKGMHTIMEQTIAPLACERDLIGREQSRYPGWENPLEAAGPAVESFIERERQEWELCDLILCGSDFVKDSIAAVGGPSERCKVVPYGFEFPWNAGPRNLSDHPLRILTLGTVCLRKGIADVLKVAEALKGRMVFRAVGPSNLLPPAIERMHGLVELPGAVPRSEVAGLLEWADILIFPSLCEGSATVCYEALASGVPVICTPNTGSVVRDGIEGFLVNPGDVDTMIARLNELDQDRQKLAEMSDAAIKRQSYFTMEAYAARLKDALSELEPLAAGSIQAERPEDTKLS